ncbi:MAG TPA: SUMF1/EgtB/PvdO family nonheme iron enzyme [Terriglobales bacterium]|nr:SUMF1/EgtB/PvdO family nonheme iron enzyme [Terriglobales bacterium]
MSAAATAEMLERREALARGRALTDSLFAEVRADAFYDRPIPERHRILFYAGHLEAFDWNLIGRGALGRPPVSQELDRLFAFGIDPPPGQLPQDQPGDWPTPEQSREYVQQARGALDAVLEVVAQDVFDMALEHRLMHAETLTYMLHSLSRSRRRTPDLPLAAGAAAPPLRMIEIPAGTATLGQRRGAAFGWDNEFEAHRQEAASFAISRHKITNAQYLEFVRAGGAPPHYWEERGGRWYYHGMSADVPVPNDLPVYVSQEQAVQYAQWAGKSLPTECQFHRAAFGTPEGGERTYPWGEEAPEVRHGNFHFFHRDLVPVTATPAGDSAFGVAQLVGNGWEWTASVFAPFPGFTAAPLYPGYSSNFFDGDHYVLQGASCVTHARLLRPSFRNWFRKSYPYAYATFRLVEN